MCSPHCCVSQMQWIDRCHWAVDSYLLTTVVTPPFRKWAVEALDVSSSLAYLGYYKQSEDYQFKVNPTHPVVWSSSYLQLRVTDALCSLFNGIIHYSVRRGDRTCLRWTTGLVLFCNKILSVYTVIGVKFGKYLIFFGALWCRWIFEFKLRKLFTI